MTSPNDPTDAILSLIPDLAGLPIAARVAALNRIRRALHEVSPFQSEPVDCVEWVPTDGVSGNDYNPNTVAPPEMRLLRLSITADGYTQPIVTHREADRREVVDGFHRHRVAKECADVRDRIHGYLPVVTIKPDRTGRSDRVAATIRHNRARGVHGVSAMAELVADLKRRGWTPVRIGTELGMEPDEVLRLCQVTGLAELFADRGFSEAWDVAPGRKRKGKERA